MHFYPAAASPLVKMKMNSLFPHSLTGGTAAFAHLKQLGKFKVVVFHLVSEQQWSSLLCGFSRVPPLHRGCFSFQPNCCSGEFGRILKSGAASGRMEMQCIVIWTGSRVRGEELPEESITACEERLVNAELSEHKEQLHLIWPKGFYYKTLFSSMKSLFFKSSSPNIKMLAHIAHIIINSTGGWLECEKDPFSALTE